MLSGRKLYFQCNVATRGRIEVEMVIQIYERRLFLAARKARHRRGKVVTMPTQRSGKFLSGALTLLLIRCKVWLSINGRNSENLGGQSESAEDSPSFCRSIIHGPTNLQTNTSLEMFLLVREWKSAGCNLPAGETNRSVRSIINAFKGN